MAREALKTGLTPFGRYLQSNDADRRKVAKDLDITPSYVSMLCRGPTTPGLKLALRIQKWSGKEFGEDKAFGVGDWS